MLFPNRDMRDWWHWASMADMYLPSISNLCFNDALSGRVCL